MIPTPDHKTTGKRTTVTAVTPIEPGADLDLLQIALTSALLSLGEPFQWRYACGPDEADAVRQLAEDCGIEAAGIITTSKNVAHTRNRLAASGTGDYLLAMDADDQWAPGGLAQMKWVLDTRTEVAAAHGRAVDTSADGTTVIFDPPAWWNTFVKDTAPPGMLARRRKEMAKASEAWYNAPSFLVCYPHHQGAGLYRREAVLAVGGWDEDLGNYGEDTALTAKLSAHYAWHITHGTVVLLYRKHGGGSLTGRFLSLTPEDYAVLNEITDCHEQGRSEDAPLPPFRTPPADRTPRPVLDVDASLFDLEVLDGQLVTRSRTDLRESFIKPLTERDPAAKTDAEYAAMEDPDDAAPDLDDLGPELRGLLGTPPTPDDKDA